MIMSLLQVKTSTVAVKCSPLPCLLQLASQSELPSLCLHTLAGLQTVLSHTNKECPYFPPQAHAHKIFLLLHGKICRPC